MASKSSHSTNSSASGGRKAPSRPVAGGPASRFIMNSRCFVGAYRKTYASIVKPHHPRYSEDEFEIGPQVIRFTAKEVAVLLGLPLSGQALDLTLNLGSDIQNRFLEGQKVDRKNLEVVLKEMSNKQGEEDITDFVKLLILYFFYCILFTNTNNLCPKGLVGLVDDLPALSWYNWPEAVHRLIIDSLCSATAKLQANSKRVGYVLGCTLLLPPPIIINIPELKETSKKQNAQKLKFKVPLSSANRDLKYYGKGELPKEDQERIEKFLISTSTEPVRVPSKGIDIGRTDFIDLTRHMAFVSSNIIDAYQNLLEQAEGHKCIYTTSFFCQTIGTSMNPAEMFLQDINEEVITGAKYWFIPLFHSDHWHLLAVDLQAGKYIHLSSIKNPKYNAGFETTKGWNLNFSQKDVTKKRGEIAAEFLRHFYSQ
uniref:Ubiquitin-like protease family profile domain-containing protein n=1 Tax=Ananas comosus var. bracteatus TaxID=296719 RepID=A0A6V7NZS6_ANACO|nr:unnamed protein product [Ananas comosus var. bracteatus]